MCFSSGGAADDYAKEQRAAEQARQARIAFGKRQIDDQFSKFDEPFYNKQSQAYLDYAAPQIDRQYNDANRGLVFALARQGIGQSTEGNRRFGNLLQDQQLAQQGMVDKSRDVATGARKSVEDTRSNLIADLYATADPAAAAKGALSRAQYLMQPQGFSPVGQLFSNVLDGLNSYQSSKQDAADYNNALNAFGLSNTPTSSGRNVG
jgi:hypothetical protein